MPTPIRKSPTVFPYRGKWRLKYLDVNGRERTKTAETKQGAYDLLIKLGYLHAQGKSLYEARSGITLGEWLEVWLADHSTELRPKTLANNRSLIRNHLRPSLGHLPLSELNVAHLEATYRALQREKGLSAATVHRIHAILSVALKGAVRYGLISTDPSELVKKPRAERKTPQTLRPEQVDALLEMARLRGPRCELRWTLALRYGLRQGEALGLCVQDLDPDRRLLTISRQLQRVKGQGFRFDPPKSERGNRVIPISADVAALAAAVIAPISAVELLFPGPSGEPRHSSYDRAEWLSLLAEAGIAQMPLHSARHTAATAMIQAGVNVRAVQLVLGHSTPSFTLATYVHPSVSEIREALAAVSW